MTCCECGEETGEFYRILRNPLQDECILCYDCTEDYEGLFEADEEIEPRFHETDSEEECLWH